MTNATLTRTDSPQVFITCLSAYNNGYLHGEWVEATDENTLIADKDRIIQSSPMWPDAEEWFLTDFQGFGDISIGEYTDLATVAALGQAIEGHGEAFGAYCSHHGYTSYYSIDDLVSNFEEDYQGQWDSEEDFIQEMMKADGTWDAVVAVLGNDSYIDVEQIACDRFIDTWISFEISGKECYVFARR